MIAYFDTSAVIPLLIEEPASAGAVRLWDEATRIVSTHLLYPEARSALARAQRVGRLSEAQHTLAKHGLAPRMDAAYEAELTDLPPKR